MKKLFALLILAFFSIQSHAGSCPDGSDPVKSISADGTYFVYKCGNSVLDAPKAEFYQRQYDMNSKVDQILSKRKTINPFLAWNYSKYSSSNHYGIEWTNGLYEERLPSNSRLELETPTWNYYYVGQSWGFWKDHAKQQTFVTNIDWDHDAEYGVTKAMNIIDPAYPKAFAEEVYNIYENGIHGLLLDWWHIQHPTPWRGTKLENAMIDMTDEIRRKVGDDFLLLGNSNQLKNINLLKPINGVFLEWWKNHEGSYTFTEIAEMEEVIKFNEKHLRYPKLIAFEPWRITDKSDPTNRTSEDNLRFSRLYSAMATVIPEHGYILYADNNQDSDEGDHDHYYYDVYSVDLGKPVSKYTPITEGVAYKKFEDGYIAFNRLDNDVTVNFGDFEVIIPSMDAVFLNKDGTIYVGCEAGFIKKDGICMEDDSPIFSEDFEKAGEEMNETPKGTLFESLAEGSILLNEDFENSDQRDLLIDDRDNTWHVKQDIDGNSTYCNKKVTTDDYASFNLGNENWRDYSISYRMKFATDKGGELETHIRKNSNRQGEYRSVINSVTGNNYLKYVKGKGAERINKKIAYGSRSAIRDQWADIQLIATGNYIEFHVNGKVVSYTEDDRLEKGAAMFAVTSHSEDCIDDTVIKKESEAKDL
jgi:hypothetical protein